MPNWCANQLTVKGDPEKIAAFSEAVSSEQVSLDFDIIKPTPSELLEGDGWYNWRVMNWGTKWNLSNEDLQVDELDDQIIYNFDSAWSPPLPIVEAMADKFPELEFSICYFEQGMCYAGMLTICVGDQQRDEFEHEEESDCQAFVNDVWGEETWWVPEDEEELAEL